ncbi:MAG: hypothetical protein HY320_15845 [Armatimonadetes bacterium]|nr:hypothetical protein [Armatimonadota bacterium]
MATAIFYAVDLGELRHWIGRGEPKALAAVRRALRESEDFDWEPEEEAILDRLLERLVMEGRLYEGLNEEERYYLTQLLVDLFDEFVEAEAVSEEIPLARLAPVAQRLRDAGGVAAQATEWLTRGRELNGQEPLIPPGVDPEDLLPYFGYLERAELPAVIEALERSASTVSPPQPSRARRRPDRTAEDLLAAARLCAQTDRDLLDFVG